MEGFSKVPEEIARRVGEAYGVSCALYVMDIDGTMLHLLGRPPTSGYPVSVGGQAKDSPAAISLVDGEQTPGRVVFERKVASCEREEWIGQKPLEEEYLTAVPVRAADATNG
ncbi:MAG: hypothetical protein L0G70_10650, partial [Rubrobacter sp.]|nr:hypothetical protein [Rubrobacter sp.]